MDLFDLSARISVDAKGVDSTLASTQRKVHSLTDSFRRTDSTGRQAFEAISRSAIGSNAGISRLTSTFEALGGSLGVVTLGVGALAAAAIGLGTALFMLAKNAAEAVDELDDLSQKTNFSVESLSALQNILRVTGGDIKSLSGSLVIFQSNMVAARDSTSEMGKTFAQLKIDTVDQEKALREALATLYKMGQTATQTATAKKLFGRAGKEVLGIVKETNGNLDAAIEKYKQLGTLIGGESVASARQFNDTLQQTTDQLNAVTRQIGLELLPIATESLQQISDWLKNNKSEWMGWGTAISDVLRTVKSIAQSEIGQIIYWIGRLSLEVSGIPSILRGLGMIGADNRPLGPTPGDIGIGAGILRKAPIGGAGVTGSGGGGGGSKVSPGQQLLNKLTDEYNQLLVKANSLTRAQAIEQELLQAKYKGTGGDLRILIQAKADSITALEDETKANQAAAESWHQTAMEVQRMMAERLALTDQLRGALNDQYEAINRLNGVEETHLTRASNLVTNLAELMKSAGGVTAEFRELAAAYLRAAAAADELVKKQKQLEEHKKAIESWSKHVQGIAKERDEEMQKASEEFRRQQEERQQQIRALAGDLTRSIDNAIYEGMTGGIKRGMAVLAMDLLSMLKNVFLKQLEEGLTQVLSNVNINGGGGTGGKGGILGAIFGTILGGLGGVFGGSGGLGSIFGRSGGTTAGGLGGILTRGVGGSVAGSFAKGIDYVPFDNFPAYLHRGERVLTAQQNATGGTVVVQMTVNTPNAQSFMGRDTQTQISHKMQSVMKQAAVRVS